MNCWELIGPAKFTSKVQAAKSVCDAQGQRSIFRFLSFLKSQREVVCGPGLVGHHRKSSTPRRSAPLGAFRKRRGRCVDQSRPLNSFFASYRTAGDAWFATTLSAGLAGCNMWHFNLAFDQGIKIDDRKKTALTVALGFICLKGSFCFKLFLLGRLATSSFTESF